MMAELVVFGTIALAAAFTLAWVIRGDLRQWLESPKHGFDQNVRRYDRETLGGAPHAADREEDPARLGAHGR